jgi:hypothetical protein
MPTQTINFANVNNATFNGSSVEIIKLNNTTIWEKPTTVTTQYVSHVANPKLTEQHIAFASSAYASDANSQSPASALGSWTGPTSVSSMRVDYIGFHRLGTSGDWVWRIKLLGYRGSTQPISKVTIDGLDIYPDYNYQNTQTTGAGVWETSWSTPGGNWTIFGWGNNYSVGGVNLHNYLSTRWGTATTNKTVPVEIHT